MEKKHFILDEGNRAAYALAEIIGEASVPAIYNPAIIFGNSGNGKSHLINIIQASVLEKGKNIIVTSGQQLVEKLIYEIRNTKNFTISEFCKKFYETDVLIVEDIQYIKDTYTTQECLIKITQHFVEQEKQILFTMNCAPADLDMFEMQFRARFQNSIQLNIEDSTEELRTKIVEDFCKEKKWEVSETMKRRVAGATKTPAEVLGVMKQVMFYKEEIREYLNQELIEKVLKERKIY